MEGSFLEGSRTGRVDGDDVVVSHSLYANDTVIFCGTDVLQGYLRDILICFEAVCSLKVKVNAGKSEITPMGEVNGIHLLAEVLDARWVLSLHLTWVFLWVPH